MRKHRRVRGRKLKKQRRIILASIIGITLLMTAGYAAFGTNIEISAKGNLNSEIASEKLKKLVVTSGDGLYKDVYETDRYIYKGANPDNYIQFNGERWRIYSIENNGVFKIIKNVPLESTTNFDSVGARTTGYCSFDYAPTNGCNAWAATSNLIGTPSVFTNGSVSGAISADSYLNTYLNSGEYWTNILSDDAKRYVYTEGIWNVGPSGRWEDNNTLYDLVSTTFEKKYQWRGKVALLTKSEYMRASNYDMTHNDNLCGAENTYWTNYETCRQYNYLYNSSYDFKLISPFYNSNYQVADGRRTGKPDFLTVIESNTRVVIRPVVYLKSDIILSGKGTEQKPYKIVEQ